MRSTNARARAGRSAATRTQPGPARRGETLLLHSRAAMADKPRVRAPKQRATTRPDDPSRNRRLLMYGVGAVIALAALAAAVFLAGFGGNDPNPEKVRADLEAAGLHAASGEGAARSAHARRRTRRPTGTPIRPTSGPHFGFDDAGNLGTVIWGAYEEPLQLARVVHNLEHGGIYIFYGDEVPDAVVAELREFYDSHERGTLLAPYPNLADEIALGAWVSDGGEETGYLAKCTAFDESGVLVVLQRVPVQGPGAVPGGLASARQQLERASGRARLASGGEAADPVVERARDLHSLLLGHGSGRASEVDRVDVRPVREADPVRVEGPSHRPSRPPRCPRRSRSRGRLAHQGGHRRRTR